jgi:F420-non-reducing hydrogenase iron-sulfur subunit
MDIYNNRKTKILVFSTEKISDPAIDMAGLLKLHYPSTVYTISVPCSSGIKPAWIMHAFEKGFDGVFIAAGNSPAQNGSNMFCMQRGFREADEEFQ